MKRKISGIIMVFSLASSVLISGCGKNRVENYSNIFAGGATGEYGDIYVVYDDELKTGGGLFLFPGEQNQIIDISYSNTPCFGRRCIMYQWNGGDVYNYNEGINQKIFAGFALALTDDRESVLTADSRDFSMAGYTKVVFSIKGSLSENVSVKIEAPDDGSSAAAADGITITSLSGEWQEYTFNITPSRLANVREFFKCAFIYNIPDGTSTHSNGGTVFLDNIYYSK